MSRTLTQLLQTLPDVYGQLEDALHGTATGPGGERVSGGGGDDRPAPLQLQVAEHRAQLVKGVRYWLARTQAELRLCSRGRLGDRLELGTAWLLDHHRQLSAESQAELADNLAGWLRKARSLTDLPQLRGTLPLGGCLNTGELWSCAGTLTAMLPADRRRQVYLSCRDCGGRWDVTELPDAANVQLPVHLAAELLGVTVRTVQRRAADDRDAGTVRLGDALRSECAPL